MSTNVLQPSLSRRREFFGGIGLQWPTPQGEQFLLQMPLGFSWARPDIKGQMSQNIRPLVDLSRDWVAMVLKTNRTPKKQKSVLDMPPLNLGRVLRSVDARDDLLEEMLDDARF